MPMTAREAIRLTKKMGGRFVRHGAKHDIFGGFGSLCDKGLA